MPFLSDTRGYTIIDDSNWKRFADETPVVNGEEFGRGLLPPEPDEEGVAAGSPFSIPTIPRTEWNDRIEEMTRTQSRITDLCKSVGLGIRSQARTNYCWIFAPVRAMEIQRVIQGQKPIELSPASAGAKITGYRNVGGWPTKGIQFLEQDGCATVQTWPATAIDRRYDTSQSNQERNRYKVDEWWELGRMNFDQLMTALLLHHPTAIALMWWRHAVCAVNPVVIGRNTFGVEIDNSWGASWSNGGRGIIEESKARADQQVTPRTVTAS